MKCFKWKYVEQFPDKDWDWKDFHTLKCFKWEYVVQFPDKRWSWECFHNMLWFSWNWIEQFPYKNWKWESLQYYLFNGYGYIKWEYFCYLLKNNKIEEKLVMKIIKNIQYKKPKSISNILKMNCEEDIKIEMIYSYIYRDGIIIKNEYLYDIF